MASLGGASNPEIQPIHDALSDVYQACRRAAPSADLVPETYDLSRAVPEWEVMRFDSVPHG